MKIDADLSNNKKSIDQSLDKYLYFVVKSHFGKDEHWVFPQQLHQPGESLRNTAERILENHFPSKLQNGNKYSVNVKFLGNAPSCYYSYRYPSDIAEEKQKLGLKMFLFKCELDRNKEKHESLKGPVGNRVLVPKVDNFMWLTRDELKTQMPERYWDTISNAIFVESLANLDEIVANRRTRLSYLTRRLQKIEASAS